MQLLLVSSVCFQFIAESVERRGGQSSETWSVPSGENGDPKEAELGPPQGCPSAAYQRVRGHILYP